MSRSLKVAMLIQGYYPHVGGAERQLASLAPRLIAQGLSVKVYTRHTPRLPAFDLIAGVPVHRLPAPGTRATRSLSFTLTALNTLRKSRPDLIHAHDLFSPSTTALLAKKLFNIPLVVKVVRGGYLGDLQWLSRRTLGKSRISLLCKYVDRFIVISEEIDKELADLGVEDGRRVFIPNGVDCERFFSVTNEQRTEVRNQLELPDAPMVIYTGRLAKEKRVSDLISIWPAVREKYADASLLIVGSGDQEATLKKMAPNGVIFAGAVTDVAPYLRAADIFALPSVAEGLSNALLEAMASGLACISTDVGGAQELIKSGESGVLIPPEAPSVLLEQTLALLANPTIRRSMGIAARGYVKDNYSLDFVAQSLNALYRNVLSGG